MYPPLGPGPWERGGGHCPSASGHMSPHLTGICTCTTCRCRGQNNQQHHRGCIGAEVREGNPPCVTFRPVVVPLRGPGQSPVLPFACCVGSLLSVGRCGRCSCGCRFRVRGAQSLVCRGCAGCGRMCLPPPPPPEGCITSFRGGGSGTQNSTAFGKAPRREADSQPISQSVRQAVGQAGRQTGRTGRLFSVADNSYKQGGSLNPQGQSVVKRSNTCPAAGPAAVRILADDRRPEPSDPSALFYPTLVQILLSTTL